MFDVPGYRVIKVLGAVYGITVRSRNWAAGLGMVLKSIAGGELRWFTNMVSTFAHLCPHLLLALPRVNISPYIGSSKGRGCRQKVEGTETNALPSSTMPVTMLLDASWTSARGAGATRLLPCASTRVTWADLPRCARMALPATWKKLIRLLSYHSILSSSPACK